MPIISDEELLGLHSQIEKEKNEKEEIESDLYDALDKVDKQSLLKKIFFIVSVALFLVIVGAITFFFLKPTFFISDSIVAKTNFVLVHKDSLNISKALDSIKTETVKSKAVEEKEEKTNNTPSDVTDSNYATKGLIFKIQIAAFQTSEIEIYSSKFKHLRVAQEGAFFKYQLGAFNNLKEANRVLDFFVNKIGVRDAFVVAYFDGKKINIQEAVGIEKELTK